MFNLIGDSFRGFGRFLTKSGAGIEAGATFISAEIQAKLKENEACREDDLIQAIVKSGARTDETIANAGIRVQDLYRENKDRTFSIVTIDAKTKKPVKAEVHLDEYVQYQKDAIRAKIAAMQSKPANE